jgi:hypothetical protein
MEGENVRSCEGENKTEVGKLRSWEVGILLIFSPSHLLTFSTSIFCFCCILLSGCGYTLQTRSNLPFDDIWISKIENKTHEPKLEDRLYLALAKNFMQYGFSLNSRARYRIEGDIYYFELLPTTEVNLTATQYQVVMKVRFNVIDTESGKSIHLAADSPFITYFGATGRIEDIMTQKELAEDAFMANLAQTLVSLVTYTAPKNITSLLFQPGDIKNVEGLIIKLREANDKVSEYIRAQLSSEVRRRIDAWTSLDYPADELKAPLSKELNSLIENKNIFDEKRFAGIKLSDEALRLIRQNAQGFNLERLNRMLLEEAYPGELAKTAGNRQ